MIFHDIEQNTPEWFQLRAGRITMSELHKIMANYGKAFGDPAKQYAVNVAIEQITGNPIPSSIDNHHLHRGHEQEPIARSLYEADTFKTVSEGGFFCNDIIGYSPDGLIKSENGAIEIKSVLAHIHYANVKRQGVDPTKKWQCLGALNYAKLDWIDFVSFCPDFPEGDQLYVFRMEPVDYEEEFGMIENRVEEFLSLVSETKETILKSKYL